jgi:hypothetical protein
VIFFAINVLGTDVSGIWRRASPIKLTKICLFIVICKVCLQKPCPKAISWRRRRRRIYSYSMILGTDVLRNLE